MPRFIPVVNDHLNRFDDIIDDVFKLQGAVFSSNNQSEGVFSGYVSRFECHESSSYLAMLPE